MWEAKNKNGACFGFGDGAGGNLPRAAVCQPLLSVDPHD
eukprot:COSAG02_NODE_15514_length_1164_cov_0.990610_1_plen_38_part_01